MYVAAASFHPGEERETRYWNCLGVGFQVLVGHSNDNSIVEYSTGEGVAHEEYLFSRALPCPRRVG